MSTNFHLAPPPKTINGLLAVPIDIQTIDAAFSFDGASQTASADSTITYTVGPDGGNLIFDQFDLRLEICIINTLAAHSVITNGAITELGTNHWRIVFPGRFTALSPMLEIWSSDLLVRQTDSTSLPISGKTVTLEAWKPLASAVDLGVEINTLKILLAQNENDFGSYLHDNRFVTFFNGGGMEYEGGTTTSPSALAHETFHSWFARGIKPASQSDGWWDEGFTSFHDDGADDAIPFDFSDPPVTLCSLDPWQRHTPLNAYTDGDNFWKGMASLLGVAPFKSSMGVLYNKHKGNPVSTAMIEEFLVGRSGNAQAIDAFHRFAYGFSDPYPAPDLWLKDDPAHSGMDQWEGVFWDSPDLWIRNADDGGTDHQSPEYGQDNWFHARVRNKAGAGTAKHFVVTFHSRGFAGTEFVYPNDFLPCIAAKAEFELAPGGTRIVKARWPRELVPSVGTFTCLLASVLARSDHPVAGRHVWEHNNLAQKNLTVVDLLPDTYMILPIVVGNWFSRFGPGFYLELWKPENAMDVSFSLIHRSKEFFVSAKVAVKEFIPALPRPATHLEDGAFLDCGGHIHGPSDPGHGRILTSNNPELILRRFPSAWEASFRKGCKTRMVVEIPSFTQKSVGLKIAGSPHAKSGQTLQFHFVQRCLLTRQIVGGVAVRLNIFRRSHV